MEIELGTDKRRVMSEVAQTTAYTGAKMAVEEASTAMKRISTVDEDEGHLEMFWDESRAELYQELKGMIIGEEIDEEGGYELKLKVSESFDETLSRSMEISLEGYFVNSIVSRWYMYTNKGEAGVYAEKARRLLEDIHRKGLYKKQPKRPKY